MINEDLIYFNELAEHRARIAVTLDDPAVEGFKRAVVEKYSDQAHFIYELLQNADDAYATEVHFELHKHQLVFVHNGTRRFTISDQKKEKQDKENGKLGDLNAITSIGNSSKEKASIGKFGIGFKSVFQYTLTPHIYDPGIAFKIHSFIVPERLLYDYPGRGNQQTVFVFPFDHTDRSEDVAFLDIAEKLRTLNYPVLFLQNLLKVTFSILGEEGLYEKSVSSEVVVDQTRQQFITITQNDTKTVNKEKLWLFSRTTSDKLTYSVGYFIGEEGQLIQKKCPAFCFFSTRETTNLNFVIHAPFLLTDSREGIQASQEHNRTMVQLLANLSADSLVCLRNIGIKQQHYLITDNIFDIIPYKPSDFTDISDRNSISFKPFYDTIINKMKIEYLLPTKDGYTNREKAYWANVAQLTEIFPLEQLAQLTGDEEAQWVFISSSRQESELIKYINEITCLQLTEEKIFNGWPSNNSTRIPGITKDFIKKQPIEWLTIFYDWILKVEGRTNRIKSKPIFLNQTRQAVSAKDETDKVILFFPTETKGYTTVWPELLGSERAVALLTQLGVQQPTLYDEIYNQIFPIYKQGGKIVTQTHFKKFFEYYTQCPKIESEKLINQIKDLEFIRGSALNSEEVLRYVAKNLYLPTEHLTKWFQNKKETVFVKLDDYVKLVGEQNKEQLIRFLKDLGVNDEARLLKHEPDSQQLSKLNIEWPYSKYKKTWTEYFLDGSKENIEAVIKNNDKQLSLLLWEQFVKFSHLSNSYNKFKSIITGRCDYFYYSQYTETYNSSEILNLRQKEWLFDENGNRSAPQDIKVEKLDKQYNVNSAAAQELLKDLGIQYKFNEKAYSDLDEEAQKKLRLGHLISDIPEEDLKRLIEQYHANKQNSQQLITALSQTEEEPQTIEERLAREIGKLATSTKGESSTESEVDDRELEDEDTYIKPSVNFQDKIERAKEQSANEIARIAHLNKLTEKAMSHSKYSFGWFKALLDLEAYNKKESAAKYEISIGFAKVEKEEHTSRILILTHPTHSIPHSLEDLADIPLDLYFINGKKIRMMIEVVNVKSYILRAKLKSDEQIEHIDLSLVREAKIEAKNPIFLMKALQKAFRSLPLEEDFDMKQNLSSDIEFVFGPPGTGKTTYLAKDLILPLIQKESPKILVLTPTNKAADVLVRRLMDIDEQQNYKQWLVRFGATNDPIIERNGVFYDKTVDIEAFTKNVTVTTIARFPYDHFISDDGTLVRLSEVDWDYIMMDEASMIPLADIMYPLYKKKPKKFIIAGDPFQIEPITTVDLWKNENIYTTVQLKSFENPVTVPHAYKVILLTTQYRSVPEIGSLFSQFAYDSALSHHRTVANPENTIIADKLQLQPLTFVKFPVSKHESIYTPKRLQNRSSYHIYAALFTFEYVKNLSAAIEQRDEPLRLGIITPYHAQAELLDKLIASYAFPDSIDIQAGTIHGFQGDECDFVITLFNSPPSNLQSKEMFLNKLNIINVAISRARDYLIVVMPDNATENVDSLTMIKRLESLSKSQQNYVEYHAKEIEKSIFGSETYLEDNSFSTSHQLVNVYGKPEKKYEIRSETSAIDLQIYE
ncbi:DEAD/DEAH box helicase [Solibacillus cecembensis]|uniref:DEAD/DEAH box helicase n=1 Tax=Solibacillus cecembensis TaxID=459347 RepID=UPI003CFD1D0C